MAADTPEENQVVQAETASAKRLGLELQLISLLEQRIAQLEAQIKSSNDSSAEAHAQEDGSVSGSETSKQGSAETNVQAAPTEDVGHEEYEAKQDDDEGKEIKDEVRREERSIKKDGGAQKPRVRNVIKKYNMDEAMYEIIESGSLPDDDFKEESKNITTFRKVMERNDHRKLEDEELEIESPELRAIYRECVRHEWFKEDRVIESSAPFISFVYAWDRFVKACEPCAEDSQARREAREDLKQVLSLIRKSASLESYFKARDAIEKDGIIKYEHLWTLFRPGELVYARPMSPEFPDYQMFEVWVSDKPEEGLENDLASEKEFEITCVGMDFDGAKFERFFYYFKIKQFDNERRVENLEIFPTRFYRNKEGLRDDSELQSELLGRGRQFVEFCVADNRDFQCDYNGAAMAQATSGLARLTSSRTMADSASSISADDDDLVLSAICPEIHGPVVVDNYSYLRSERHKDRPPYPPLGRLHVRSADDSDCPCEVCKTSSDNQWRDSTHSTLISQGQAFSEAAERLRMCPPKVLGYALKQKMWAQFKISNLKRSSKTNKKNPFEEDLQLEKENKEILMAYVANHEASKRQRQGTGPEISDVISDKGKGLAILLHGAPGVGKTLTAETIALATGRPLLNVGVSEVGTEAKEAEEKLSAIFADAARWEAILLVDEADVFLEARERTENPNRNALVSVLLRCLEYYEGIIILTTNRIRSFDVAVQSRMHLAIQYDDLTPAAKSNIYYNLLCKIPKTKRDYDLQDARLRRVLEPLTRRGKMNGRQIRNVVTSACALANARSKDGDDTLRLEDLEKVHHMTLDFISSMQEDTKAARSMNELRRG